MTHFGCSPVTIGESPAIQTTFASRGGGSARFTASPSVPRTRTGRKSKLGSGSFASRSGNANSTKSFASRETTSVLGGSMGAVTAGPSRPTVALPAARQRANARTSARRRSDPGGVASSPATSTSALLVADVDDPLLGEEVERGGPALAVAEAGVFDTTEGHLRLAADGRNVHMENPGLRLFGRPQRRTEIARIDGGRQAVSDGVRDRERALEVVRRNDAHDRAEDLFLRDAHVRVDIREDRRLDEVACLELRLRRRAAVAYHTRALSLLRLDPLTHFPELR